MMKSVYMNWCKIIEDVGNNADVDDGQTDGHSDYVYHEYTDTHIDELTWYDVVRRGMIIGRNVRICIA